MALDPHTTRPTIALVMIVKDESHIITEAFESVRGFIDTWCIVDTGSTDGTQDLIRSYFAEANIPGTLHEREWVNFAINRSQSLQLARDTADYSFVLDADDLVVGQPDFCGLNADAYMMRIGDGFTYWRSQLFSNKREWEYRGVVHEYAACAEPCGPIERLDGDYYIDTRRLGARNLIDDKYERDTNVLRAELERDPNDSRTVFYLAQSRFDAGDATEAYDLYSKRTEMGGWDEEIFYSHLQRARALDRMGAGWEQVLSIFLEAWNFRPSRIEPLIEIARHYRSTSEWELAHLFASRATDAEFPDGDLLFVAADCYRWQAQDERAIAAYYTGRYQESFDHCASLLTSVDLPLDQRERVLSNMMFAVPFITPNTTTPVSVIERLTERFAAPCTDPRVTLTITTCKRRDLFERTIDSFLLNCRDLEAIDRWMCIDDCSSEADRLAMIMRYPFFEFIWKDESSKGHSQSMERLRNEVSSPYWLHLEDDWEFFLPDNYIARAQAILEDDPSIAQVLFNRNYAEIVSESGIPGGDLRTTTIGKQPYRWHTYFERDTEDYITFNREVAEGAVNNAYWPNFSLRPSMMRTDAINDIGAFSSDAPHFELDFAQRFTAAGLHSAFFDALCTFAIGTLTTDKGPDRKPNAYDLNGEPQFGHERATQAMTTVRLTGFWASPEELVTQFERQTMGKGRWNNIQLTSNENADITVILNHCEGTPIDKSRSIIVHMEPEAGVRTWGPWSNPTSDDFLHVRRHAQFPNVAEWHLGATWAELGGGDQFAEPLTKTRDLSTVISNKHNDPGHQLRITFVQHLVANGVPIDVFGRGAIEGVTNHKGELPDRDKRDGLYPYRYTFAAENYSEHNYVTEKLFDAILSECLCFYWGCPNLEQLVNPDAFVRLPLEDPVESQRIIEEAIASDLWSQRIDAIRAEKKRILNEYQLIPVLERTVRGLNRFNALPIRVINLDRRPDRWTTMSEHLARSTDSQTAAKFERVAGVCGLDLDLTPEIQHLFRNNDFNFRRGIIGCAQTHLALWQAIADGDAGMMLIAEDDIGLVNEFRDRFIDALGQLPDTSEFDLAFLGSHRWDYAPDRTDLVPRNCWRPMVWEDFLGGTFSYLVTKAGARKLLDIAERDGIQTAIDWFPMRHGSELRALECTPDLAISPLAWPGRSGDSDIQHDFEVLRPAPPKIHAHHTDAAHSSE